MLAPSESTPILTHDALRDALQRLGLNTADTVVVHSSLSGLGYVDGGAATVIDALLSTVGPGGTVIFPTLTGTAGDSPRNPPVMEVATTPCWTGRIPEVARMRPDGRRSLHPTHSVAVIGAAADRYASVHESSASPCDEHSPWRLLIEDGASILLLGGVTQQSNTTLHSLEEETAVPCHLQPEPTEAVVIDADGKHHRIRNRLHQWGWERHFRKLDDPLLEEGAMRCGSVGASTSCLISACKLASIVQPVLRRDPLFLLSDGARHRFEAGTR